MKSIPFVIAGDWAEVRGILRRDGEDLVLEYEGRMLYLVNTGVSEARIPLNQLAGVEFVAGGWLSLSSIVLRPISLKAIEPIPWRKQGVVTLSIERPQVEDARAFVENLRVGG